MHRLAIAGLGLLGLGCGDPERRPCMEPEGVGEALERAPLMVRGVEVSAELARTEQERTDAWVGRQCDLDALLWVPDAVQTVSIDLCGVQVGVDLALLREGQVVGMERDRAPCSGSCEGCLTYGDDGPEVDAVLWLISGEVEIEVGDPVGGLAELGLPVVEEAATG